MLYPSKIKKTRIVDTPGGAWVVPRQTSAVWVEGIVGSAYLVMFLSEKGIAFGVYSYNNGVLLTSQYGTLDNEHNYVPTHPVVVEARENLKKYMKIIGNI